LITERRRTAGDNADLKGRARRKIGGERLGSDRRRSRSKPTQAQEARGGAGAINRDAVGCIAEALKISRLVLVGPELLSLATG